MSKFTKNYVIKMKDIVREGNDILRKKTEFVSIPPTETDKEELLCMLQYLKNSQDPVLAKKYGLREGIGISANQIGLDKRMFAALFPDNKGELVEYLIINPKIISHSTRMIYLPDGEGCLSIDRQIVGYVPRYQTITVSAYDIDGKAITLKLKDYAAIVFQHEIDHLNGVLFYDHINQTNPFKLPDGATISSL